VSGVSGSGKTSFCMKMASLALDKNVSVIYIDTTNYLNADNVTLTIKVNKTLY
jgi:uridine kinase